MPHTEAAQTAQELLDAGFTPEMMAQAMLMMRDEVLELRTTLKSATQGDELDLPRRGKATEPSSPEAAKLRLRYAVRYFYDLQRLRIQAAGRDKPTANPVDLSEQDQEFFNRTGSNLHALERQALREIAGLLAYFPISEWVLKQKGIGPTMAGVIISSFDIERAHTASALWAVSGLNVRDGKAPRPIKGEKLKYNSWLRTKMVGVLAGSFLKCASDWRAFYDNYKTRKANQKVDVCMRCAGTGKHTQGRCENCEGGAIKNPPWGRSAAHRHQAALRYMVKMFLAQLYVEWRTLEGLPVRPPYQEEYLDKRHHHKGQASMF